MNVRAPQITTAGKPSIGKGGISTIATSACAGAAVISWISRTLRGYAPPSLRASAAGWTIEGQGEWGRDRCTEWIGGVAWNAGRLVRGV